MKLVYKRPNSPYWYTVSTRQSTKTTDRKLAEKFAKAEIDKAWEHKQLGTTAHTWADLVELWTDLKSSKKSFRNDELAIQRFTSFLESKGVAKLVDITTPVIAAFAKSQRTGTVKGQSVNRHIAILQSMFNLGQENDLIATKLPRFPKLPEAPRIVDEMPQGAFDEIYALLPSWCQQTATVGALLGLRLSNVLGMRWEWVNPECSVVTIPKEYTKTGRIYVIPVVLKVRAILMEIERKPTGFVFLRDGTLIKNNAFWWQWNKARIQAGYPQFRPHDMRHMFASNHVRNGTPDRILAALGGWSGVKQLDRYAHLRQDHLAEYAQNSEPRPK